jgi:uncharacterized protein (UPF0210 family)
MFWQREEVTEILQMIEEEHLDIRTVTMGVSLRGVRGESVGQFADNVYEHIHRCGSQLVPTIEKLQDDLGVPITNKRLSVTPVALVAERTGADSYVQVAQAMDRVAADVGVDYIGGFSALVEKGATSGDEVLMRSIPEALTVTERVCSSINVATTRAGINMNAIRFMGERIKELAANTRAKTAASAAPSWWSSPTSPTTTPSSPARCTAWARPTSCSTSASAAPAWSTPPCGGWSSASPTATC